MKRCPECRRDYYDDTLLFCLDDGSGLLEGPASTEERATAILDDIDAPTRPQIDTTNETAILPASTGDVGRHSRGLDKRLLAAPFLLAIVVLGGLFGYRYFSPATSEQIDSIAVLPFENTGGDADSEYLSDGISEALINSLTELQQLKVIARATAFRYKGKQIDPKAVGRELSVGAVLMGRVRQVGDALSVQVDLVDAATGAQLWGREYERKLSDVLSIKQAIAREVTDKLKFRLSGDQQQQLTKRDTTNSEAYQFYLRGRYFWNKRTPENLKRAADEFRQAVDKDPNYALAYTGLADSHLLSRPDAENPESVLFAKAEAYARRALEIDESLAEAHTSLAGINVFKWQWNAAEREFERAIELNPNYATTHHWRGIYLLDAGRYDEGLASLKRAQELDPLSRVVSFAMAIAHLLKNDPEACLQQANKLVELDPNYYGGYTVRGSAYLKQGRFPEAVADMEKGFELAEGDSQILGWLGHALAVSGRRAEAMDVIKRLEEKHKRGESGGTEIAAVYVGLDDKDNAFAWLENDVRANQRRPLIEVRRSWVFQPLRGDPRYVEIVKWIGFEI